MWLKIFMVPMFAAAVLWEYLHGDWIIGCLLILICSNFIGGWGYEIRIEALEEEVAKLRKKANVATEKQPYMVIG